MNVNRKLTETCRNINDNETVAELGAFHRCVGFDEIDQFLAVEESRPHRVALTIGDDQLHVAAQGRVALFHQTGVFFERDDGINVTVDRKKRNPSFSELGQAVDGIVLGKLGLQLCRLEFKGSGCSRHSRITRDVADWVNADKPGQFFHILGRPGQSHQTAPTSAKENRLLREPPSANQLGMERREELPTSRTPKRFPNINSRDGDSRVKELPKHPFLSLVGKIRQRWRIPNPGLAWRRVGCGNKESCVALNQKDFAR